MTKRPLEEDAEPSQDLISDSAPPGPQSAQGTFTRVVIDGGVWLSDRTQTKMKHLTHSKIKIFDRFGQTAAPSQSISESVMMDCTSLTIFREKCWQYVCPCRR